MASVLSQAFFHDEDAAYTKLESIVWPNGAVCPHCGCTDRMKRMGGTATRPGLYKCYACRKQHVIPRLSDRDLCRAGCVHAEPCR